MSEGEHHRDVHERLATERCRGRIAGHFGKRGRVKEVHRGTGWVEVIGFQSVLEVPAELSLHFFPDLEVLLRRHLRPDQRHTLADVAAGVTDAEVALCPVDTSGV